MTDDPRTIGNVLLVSPHFWPSAAVGAKRFTFLARELENAGFQVRTLTFSRSVIEATDFTLPCSGSIHPVPSGLPAIGRWRRFIPRALQVPDRFLGWLPTSLFTGWRISRRSPPDVIIATGPPFTAFLAGASLQRLTGARLILDYRDPWTGFDWSGTRHARTRHGASVNRWLERRVVRRADALVFATETMREQFTTHISIPDGASTHVVTNGFDDAIGVVPRSLSPGRPTIVYAGTLYGQRRISDLTDGLHRLRLTKGADWTMPDIHVFGKIAAEDRERIAARGLAHLVHEHGRVSHAELLGYLRGADVLFLPTGGSTHYSYDIPYKLFDYLSARRPVLAFGPRDSAVARFMDTVDCGVMAFADEPDGLSQALAELLGERRRFGFSGAEQHTWTAVGEAYGRLVGGLAARSGSSGGRLRSPERHWREE